MSPSPADRPRPARFFGLMTPLAVAAGVATLLLLPNLIMHTGLHSHASHVPVPGDRTAPQSAAVFDDPMPLVR